MAWGHDANGDGNISFGEKVRDMFDGGGRGGSGDSFYSGSNEDYVAGGGTNSGDANFFDRVTNTFQGESPGGDLGLFNYTPAGFALRAVRGDINWENLGDALRSEPRTAEQIFADLRAEGSDEAQQTMQQMVDEGIVDEEGNAATDMTNVDAATDRFQAISDALNMSGANEQVQAIADNAQGFMADSGMLLSDVAPQIDPAAAGTTLDPNDPRYGLSYEAAYNPALVDTETVQAPMERVVPAVATADATGRVATAAYMVDPVTGEVRDEALVNADGLVADMQGLATGVNADGSVNYTGQALQEAATLNISKIIDTSTVSGRLLAQQLGEGNYTDSKATILGQMEIIAGEFKDSNGDPRIPAWGQSIAREINRTIAFTGMTGTAAKAAVANAMMEASLGVAEQEATFFRTATLQNLSNRQQAILNRANVMAQVEVENLNAREAAAVTNAQTFLQMDMTNLSNEQQAEVINKQARIEALFTTTAEENVNRRFNATSEMDMGKFYDQLSLQAQTFNAESINASARFNAGEENAAAQFNLTTEAARQQFEASMAYNIDAANAKWRQTVETTNTTFAFEAASTDVKNALGLSTEALNRLWDRVDNQLDYIWRSTEADEQRDYDLLMAEMAAAGQAAKAKAEAKGAVTGALIGGVATVLGSIFSDIRLKEDIQLFDTMPNGINIYTWRWNEEAKRIGADQYPGFGVIAQEIQETHPDAVVAGEDGYLKVNYRKVLQ